jgi:hypothetical protein
VFNSTARSETDDRRQTGLRQFEAVLQVLSRQADIIDGQWTRYRAACAAGAAIPGSPGGREWFAIWSGAIEPNAGAPSPQCRAWWADLSGVAGALRTRMTEAVEAARRAGIYPGAARALRAKFSMDWSGWDR